MAGLPYFEQVISFQAKYASPHTMISNALQTNGTLINEKWARFFKRYNFLVGISLDGPELIHDAHHLTGSGKGSYDLVMRGIRHLQNEGVEYFPYIQFIPCMDFVSQKSDMSGRFRITPEQYGTFLCRTFDLWYNEGYPELPIRIFENMLLVFMHREVELCVHNSCCPKMMVLETNGDPTLAISLLMKCIG